MPSELDALIDQSDGNALAMAALSRLLRAGGRKREAALLAERALALAPDDPEVRVTAGAVLSVDVPVWHFVLVRDDRRNRAYEEAILRAITPGSRVLEIGTGSGLLAMMAARAGAAHVFTCEMEPSVARAARDVIARNGFADKVTVLSKCSTDIDPAELGELPDLLVSETISNDLLGENALASVADAVARLVKPGAKVIPARGRVRVALAHDARIDARRMGVIAGFDLSPFNRLARSSYRVAVNSSHITIRSEPADLFAFEFQSAGPWPAKRATVDVRATGGPVNGILQWIALDMDETGRYQNQPGPGAVSSWTPLFHAFPEEQATNAGQIGTIFGRHDRRAVTVWGRMATTAAAAKK